MILYPENNIIRGGAVFHRFVALNFAVVCLNCRTHRDIEAQRPASRGGPSRQSSSGRYLDGGKRSAPAALHQEKTSITGIPIAWSMPPPAVLRLPSPHGSPSPAGLDRCSCDQTGLRAGRQIRSKSVLSTQARQGRFDRRHAQAAMRRMAKFAADARMRKASIVRNESNQAAQIVGSNGHHRDDASCHNLNHWCPRFRQPRKLTWPLCPSRLRALPPSRAIEAGRRARIPSCP